MLSRELPGIREFYECEGGPQAIDAYKQHRPDWIIMDIELKTIDALSAARKIRKFDDKARIVILTQHSESAYRKAALEVGAIGFVVKENLSELAGIIRSS